MEQPNLSKTILTDLDGTLVKHEQRVINGSMDMTLLPGVADRLNEWKTKGYYIIIITGRPASRKQTKAQLAKAGIYYDDLVMGVGRGLRVLINDIKPDGTITAKAYNVFRDRGLTNVVE